MESVIQIVLDLPKGHHERNQQIKSCCSVLGTPDVYFISPPHSLLPSTHPLGLPPAPLRLSRWASRDPLVLGCGGTFQQRAETQITAVRHGNVKRALRRLCSPSREQRASAFLHREMGENYISPQVWSSCPPLGNLPKKAKYTLLFELGHLSVGMEFFPATQSIVL